MPRWGLIWGVFVGCALAITSCNQDATAKPPVALGDDPATSQQRGDNLKASKRVDEDGLQIGEFRLADQPVIDGDTIRVLGIDDSIRLLSLDTEEKLHGRRGRAAAAKDFDQYLEAKRGDALRPVKAGTPMGEEASRFAKGFFDGVRTVRLERDDPKNHRGYFGRPLAYAIAEKNGRLTSYNVECVRAGMSPYFTKYGYSRRFHNQFSHAESEARKARRGIWDPDALAYRDYDERRAWWNARADFIRAFEHQANGRNDYVELANRDAIDRLQSKLGEGVTVLSTVDRIQHFKGLTRVILARQRDNGFPIIFFDRDVFRDSGIERYLKEPVTVRGVVERYKKGDYETLQIVVKQPDQVTLASLPWPGRGDPGGD